MNAKSQLQPTACPCGSVTRYELCCGRWHGGSPAPTAEALMRSRYTAFMLLNEPYLLATWHASTRPATVEFQPGMKWLGLKVVSAQEAGDRGTVEFIARYRVGGGSAARLHERSNFVRELGCWWYVDGIHPV